MNNSLWLEGYENDYSSSNPAIVRIINNRESDGDYLKSFSNFVTYLLAFVVFVVISLKQVISKSKKFTKISDDCEDLAKKQEAIPIYSPSPFGFRLPTFIETIFLTAQIKREGVNIFEKISQQYPDEPIIKIPLLTDHSMAIKCPLLIQKILGSTNTHVLNKPQHMYKYIFPEGVRQGLLDSDLKIWSPHRKILNKSFTYRIIQSFTGIINRNGKHFLTDLLDNSASSIDGIVPTNFLNDKLYFHAFNIISEIVMGEKIFTKEANESFHSHFVLGKSLIAYKVMNPLNIIPLIWWLNPKSKEFDHHFSEIRKHVRTAIHRCKQNLQEKTNLSKNEESIPFRSILDEMIYNELPDNEILNEVSTLLIAGHETTATAMQFFLQHIAEHPDLQILCQEELDSVFDYKLEGINDFSDFTMNDLSNLKCLERCILETLRITSVGPVIYRQLSAPMEVEGYGSFKKDTIFMFPIWAIHRDPKIYPNPGQFDPDRFLPENMQKRSSYAFLPFSHGPRNCIGYKVAMMEMKIVLGGILRHFNVSTEDRLEDVPIDFDFATFPKRAYKFTLTKRR